MLKYAIGYQVFHRNALCDVFSRFTITHQDRLDVEWWNLANIYFRPSFTSSLMMGDAHDLWPGQIEDFHAAHSDYM